MTSPMWAEGADDSEVVAKLTAAATVALVWTANNGVAFNHSKTEAALYQREKTVAIVVVTIGTNSVPFNRDATRWLGVWLDSQLTLKSHHATRLKEG